MCSSDLRGSGAGIDRGRAQAHRCSPTPHQAPQEPAGGQGKRECGKPEQPVLGAEQSHDAHQQVAERRVDGVETVEFCLFL